MVIAWAVLALTAALILYAYVGYPLALMLVGALRRRAPAADGAAWPSISITVPAYNEERSIASTLERLLELDYPAARQILVVSDASSDRTDEIVRSFADRGVELLRVDQRGGKTAAENAALPHLRGDIVINTDASVRVAKDGLKPLVAAFADPTVGVASGRDVSVARLQETANVGESGYVGYEMWVRRLETRVQSIIGASGCFYGIRRALHSSLVPEALSRDFAAALMAREHGYRAVSVDAAVCYVPRTRSLHTEYRRKVRTVARGIETLWYKRHLLNPLRYGLFAWMLWSHKVCRWLAPWAVAASTLALAALAVVIPDLRLPVALIALSGAIAVVGWYWPEERAMARVVAVPTFLITGNLAVLVAGLRAMRGELNPIWQPTQRASVDQV